MEELPRDELTLNGICLADIGPTEIGDREQENLAVLYSLQLTPESQDLRDERRLEALQEVQQPSNRGNHERSSLVAALEERYGQRRKYWRLPTS